MLFRTFTLLCLFHGLGAQYLDAQTSTTPTQPLAARGILPGSLQVASNNDDISLNSGNLLYRVPMYHFPGGPGSVSMDIGLAYNSSIWEPTYVSNSCPGGSCAPYSLFYNQSQTGGGWNYTFNYQLTVESAQSGLPQCASGQPVFRVTAIFPDGSRHILLPKLNSGATASRIGELAPYGFYGYGPGGIQGCSGSATAAITYYTDDGTYLRAETSAPGTNVSWTLIMPDGTKATFDPTLCGQPPVASWPISGTVGMQANKISDRNGNFLTVCASAAFHGGLFEPNFTITDQAGRQAKLTTPVGSNQDTLTAPGANTAPSTPNLTWTVNWNTFVSSATFLCSPPSGLCTVGGSGGIQSIQSIQLPQVGSENLQYQFSYGTTTNLQLKAVTTPYGSVVSYLYGGPTGPPIATYDLEHLNSGVSQKTISWTDPQNVARTQQWQFAVATSPLNGSPNKGVRVTSPDTSVTEYDYCNFAGGLQPAGASKFCAIYHPNGDVTQNVWQQNCPWGDGDQIVQAGGNQPEGNFFLQAEYRSLFSSQGYQTAVKTFGYDRNGNLLTQNEWDWSTGASLPTPSGSGPGGTAGRGTINAFYLTTGSLWSGVNGACTGTVAEDSNAYWNSGLGPVLNARVASQATDALANKQLTQLLYDNPLATANVLKELRWRSRDNVGNSVSYPSSPFAYPPGMTNANAAITQYTYGYGGALTSTTDPNGNTTTFSNFLCGTSGTGGNGIFPGTVTLPNGFQTTQTWDCSAGLVNFSKDPNLITTTKTLDKLGRPTLIAVGAATRQTNMTYSEPACAGSPCVVTSLTPVSITTTRDVNSTGDNFQTQTLDQRGQVYLTQNNDIYVKTLPNFSSGGATYEAVSNPYRSSTEGTEGWTRTKFDNMNRPVEIAHFDGSTIPTPWGTANAPISLSTIAYDGKTTTTTDEASKVRRQAVDGLGRLVSVIEDPSGLNYSTTYTYDVGNNLLGVNQSGQTRTFTYDSLNRLYQATNPESGTITYTYDAAGNLLTKKDARLVTTTMTYDSLNRVASKSYSDSTPGVTYCYDGNTATVCAGAPAGQYLAGRLTRVKSSVSQTAYTYDEFDIITSQQIMNGYSPFLFSYTYNKLSELTSATYPSGRKVNTAYDSAGRALCVWGGSPTTCPAATSAYASSVGYAANNRVKSLTMGNNLVETTTYNTRFQPTGIQAGSLLTLSFTYGTSNNNGNVQSQTITIPGLTNTQTYGSYDGVNRLTSFSETTGQANQAYSYDAFGNRSLSGWIPYSGQTPTVGSLFPNNRWAAGTGVTYDAAGNQIGITSPARSFTYDAENRQATATINSVVTAYAYDGDGKRVQKTVGSTVTTFVYDAQGRLAAEYGGPTPPLTGTTYLTGDHLGGTRLVTKSDGTVASRYDYAPFGEELTAGIDGRTSPYSANQYPTASPDGTSQKFTSKERDAETGLDFFEARYFSAAQGRFTSPDPLVWVAWQQDDREHQNLFADFIANPQNLNRYAYVLNNPLTATDPSGLYICTGDQTQCANVETQLVGARKSQNENVARAAGAYGAAGVDNGVQVGFSKNISPGNGNTGITNVSNGQSQQSRIDVTLSASQFSNATGGASVTAGATVVHEGSHVADNQAILAAGSIAGGLPNVANITHLQSEIRAYLTGAAFIAEHGGVQGNPALRGVPLNSSATIGVFLNVAPSGRIPYRAYPASTLNQRLDPQPSKIPQIGLGYK